MMATHFVITYILRKPCTLTSFSKEHSSSRSRCCAFVDPWTGNTSSTSSCGTLAYHCGAFRCPQTGLDLTPISPSARNCSNPPYTAEFHVFHFSHRINISTFWPSPRLSADDSIRFYQRGDSRFPRWWTRRQFGGKCNPKGFVFLKMPR